METHSLYSYEKRAPNWRFWLKQCEFDGILMLEFAKMSSYWFGMPCWRVLPIRPRKIQMIHIPARKQHDPKSPKWVKQEAICVYTVPRPSTPWETRRWASARASSWWLIVIWLMSGDRSSEVSTYVGRRSKAPTSNFLLSSCRSCRLEGRSLVPAKALLMHKSSKL